MLESQSSAVQKVGNQELAEVAGPDDQHGPCSVYLAEANVGIRPHNCRQFFEILYELVQVNLTDTSEIYCEKVALVEKVR